MSPVGVRRDVPPPVELALHSPYDVSGVAIKREVVSCGNRNPSVLSPRRRGRGIALRSSWRRGIRVRERRVFPSSRRACRIGSTLPEGHAHAARRRAALEARHDSRAGSRRRSRDACLHDDAHPPVARVPQREDPRARHDPAAASIAASAPTLGSRGTKTPRRAPGRVPAGWERKRRATSRARRQRPPDRSPPHGRHPPRGRAGATCGGPGAFPLLPTLASFWSPSRLAAASWPVALVALVAFFFALFLIVSSRRATTEGWRTPPLRSMCPRALRPRTPLASRARCACTVDSRSSHSSTAVSSRPPPVAPVCALSSQSPLAPAHVERKADDEARHVLALREVSQRGDEGAPVSRVERSARVRHEPQIVVDRHAHTRAPRIERAGAARTAAAAAAAAAGVVTRGD